MKYLVITLTLIFTSCSTMSLIPAIVENQNVTEIKKIIEQPYQVNGKWFYPQDYNELIEIGFAKLETTLNNGDLTKTQEYFHHDVLTGSHRSLPLPSIINVTNLENGLSAIVRINHREAYSHINIVNLSSSVFKKIKMKEDAAFVKIELLNANETFVLSKVHTFEEEKKVNDAPVSDVLIIKKEDIVEVNTVKESGKLNKTYKEIYINIATFSFMDSARSVEKTLSKFNADTVKIENSQGKDEYRVLIGPYKDAESLLKDLNEETFKKYEDLSIFII